MCWCILKIDYLIDICTVETESDVCSFVHLIFNSTRRIIASEFVYGTTFFRTYNTVLNF